MPGSKAIPFRSSSSLSSPGGGRPSPGRVLRRLRPVLPPVKAPFITEPNTGGGFYPMNALTPIRHGHGGARPGAGRPRLRSHPAPQRPCSTDRKWLRYAEVELVSGDRLDTRDVLKKITRFLDSVAVVVDNIERRLTHLETRDAA